MAILALREFARIEHSAANNELFELGGMPSARFSPGTLPHLSGREAPGIAAWPAGRRLVWRGGARRAACPGVADLGADAAQVVGELGGVLVTGQGHGTWRRSYRDPGGAAPVPGDLAS
jgi:hypothetical protein